MIASCPQCNSRYRIAREKIGPAGARIRCSRCETIFRVEPPGPRPADAASAAPVAQAPAPAAAVSPAPIATQAPVAAAPRAPAAPQPTLRALVAEADGATAKDICEFLEERGFTCTVVTQGSDALLRLFRGKPDLTVLGGHLPGVSSPVLTEIVRRSSERRTHRIVRIAPMDEPAGAPEFEADETLEPGDLPDGLALILRRMGIGVPPAPPAPAAPAPAPSAPVRVAPVPPPSVAPRSPRPAAAPAAQQTPASPSAAPQPGAEASAAPARPRRRRAPPLSDDPEIAAAERLARIAVSDVILYNEEKFAQAVAGGSVAASMAGDIEEARAHFNQRIPEPVRAKRDFLIEELERRAEVARG